MSMPILKKAALAAAFVAAFAASPAQAAFTLSDYTVDGGWFNTAESGRGATLDYLRTGVGTGVVYIALYTFDNAGNGIWLSTSVPVHESEFRKTGIPLYRYNGGNFGTPFTPPAAGVQVATLEYNFESCSSLKLNITPAAGQTTLSPVSLTYTKGEAAAGKESFTCAYTQKFTACPAGTTAAPGGAERSCILSGTYTSNIRLTNDTTWILSGLVKIGTRNTAAAAITIDPGTRITGQGQTSDYLYVEPGSKIYANGLPYAPIVFTSPEDAAGQTPSPKDWGGIVVSGNAPTNCGATPCKSEFDTTLEFGGANAAESSGVLRYVQARYAGYVFAEGKEVNAFTFQGVGSGTVAEYLQAYRGGDDGVEFFGGTNNVKHLVVTEGGDDGIDWDLGWSGKVQYALVVNGVGLGQDRGIEAANSPTNSDATPRAIPTLSNLTFIGNNEGSHAIEFKQGSGGRIWNSVLSGFKTDCLFLTGAATYAAAGTPAALSGNTLVRNTFSNCTTNFGGDAAAPYTTEAFFNANTGNSTANAQLTGFLPAANSPVQTAAATVTVNGAKDDFFDVVPYAGAFGGPETNWTVGWTVGVNP
jgi:hypothetical protein